VAALADAGLSVGDLAGHRVAVVIGQGNDFGPRSVTDSQHRGLVAQTVALLSARHPEWSQSDRDAVGAELTASLPPVKAAMIDGQAPSTTAHWVAQRLGTTGASYVMDASHASSLAALDLAARALTQGRAELAIAGGVYLQADDRFSRVARKRWPLSPLASARPFAADAGGMIVGEGAGVLLLKRRCDAERAGDRIYALVQGLGFSPGARGRARTSPSVRDHVRAIRRAYRRAGIDPATVTLIEGQGPGIPADDEAEIRAYQAVFRPPAHGHRTLGAVSSMIGHAMSASGMAGIIKTALALYHRALPPTLHAEHPHPLLASAGSPITLSLRTRPWIHADPDTPRTAGVSAFGFAGMSAHAVLEEHTASADSLAPGALLHWETEAILLSAPDRAGLIARARTLIAWLNSHPNAVLKDIAAELAGANRRFPDGARLGLVASSPSDLAQRLAESLPRLDDPSCRSIRDGRGVYYWDEPLLRPGGGGLAFLFPGEGSQYPGMLADLCLHFPEVRQLFDTSDHIAREMGETVLPSDDLFGAASERTEQLWSTTRAVNVVLSAQWALYQVLTHLGLRPDAVAGHSSGELLALAAAGVVRADADLLRHLHQLGTVFHGFESAGELPTARLVAVAAGRDRAEDACRALGAAEVFVAIDNCPHQVVMAGPPSAVERVVHRLRQDNVLCEDLPFARAYHTPGFAAVLGPVAEFLNSLSFSPPSVPIYSCASGARMPVEPMAIRELALSQWTRTVAFRQTIESMHDDGLRVFVDVGARGNLAGFVEDTLRGRPVFAIAANVPHRGGPTQLNHLVAATFAQGAPLAAGFLYARRRPAAIEWNAPQATGHATVDLKLGVAIELPARPPSMLPEAGAPPPHDLRLDGSTDGNAPDTPSSVEAALLAFQETMRSFLQTEQEVMTAYLARPGAARTVVSGPEPGPWAGEVRGLIPGAEIETVYLLDGRNDPIAQNHTLGGRRVSAIYSSLKGLSVLPFAMMAEMAAQVAALVVAPGQVLTGLEQVHAHRWVCYEEQPVPLEIRGRRVSSAGDERIWVAIFNRRPGGTDEAPRAVFEAVAIFGPSRPVPPPASPFILTSPRASRFTAESLYAEQWLFHGPPFQALCRVGPFSEQGIQGTLRVMPWEPLLPAGWLARLHTDVIVIDSFTHLLGCWGLDHFTEGDVLFPLRMKRLEIHGGRPPVGAPVACRITIHEIQRHRVRVSAEIVRPDGTVWMRLLDWEDWRFHWPGRYRDVFRRPRDQFVGEELTLDDPMERDDSGRPRCKLTPTAEDSAREPSPRARAVWLAPPADMGRPVWRDVLEHTQLGPAERIAHMQTGDGERRRTHRLWGRIAAKEAARRLWDAAGLPGCYPADLAVRIDARGRPRLIRGDASGDHSLPAISIAHSDGVSVALATLDPDGSAGIDVESIDDCAGRLEPVSRFTSAEHALLRRCPGPGDAEWVARFWCAKQAVAKAAGLCPASASAATEVVQADPDSGVMLVRLISVSVAACPDRHGRLVRVISARRGEYAWAWTVGAGVDSL
jgi:acyl transferase domain-containing protein